MKLSLPEPAPASTPTTSAAEKLGSQVEKAYISISILYMVKTKYHTNDEKYIYYIPSGYLT